jgi:ferritin-like metal-binding protein YciE
MAGHGCVRTYATLLGASDAAALFEQTLKEEKEADKALGGIAEQINVEFPQGPNQSAKRTVNSSGRRSKPAA